MNWAISTEQHLDPLIDHTEEEEDDDEANDGSWWWTETLF